MAESPEPPLPDRLRENAFSLSACHLALHVLGAHFEVKPAVSGTEPDCGIAQPVMLTEVLPGITLEGGATLRCATARALAWWMRDEVLPAASRLPGGPRPVTLALGTTYDCRMRVGDGAGAELSEHALGNAIDIAALTFDDGTRLEVGRAEENDLPAAFLKAIRSGSCLHFTTVLGPGSNAAHAGHLHLDIKQRNGGYRICE